MDANKPSISDLMLYKAVYEHWEKHGYTPDRALATKTGFPERTIGTALEGLQAGYGIKLHRFTSPGGPRELTKEAKTLYELAREVLDCHAKMRRWKREPAPPVLRVGAPAGILFHLMPDAAAHVIKTQARNFKLELHLLDGYSTVLEMVATDAVDVGFAVRVDERVIDQMPNKKAIRNYWHRIESQPLKKTIEPVLIVSDRHPVDSMPRGSQVDLPAVRAQLPTPIFVLPQDRYPHIFSYLRPFDRADGEIAIVPSYSLILTYVSLKLGVGVLPGFLDRFKEHNKINPKRRICHYRLQGVDPIRLAVFRKKGGRDFADETSTLVAAFEETTARLHKEP